jgi:hypothetical protein
MNMRKKIKRDRSMSPDYTMWNGACLLDLNGRALLGKKE